MKRLTLLAATAFAASVMCAELSAQQTSTGAFGQRTTGGTGGVQAPRGGSSSGATGSSFGNNGAEGAGATGGLSMLREVEGNASGDARYIRGNRSAGDFVGADTGDARVAGVMDIGGAGGGRGGMQQFTSLFSGGRNGNALGQLFSGQLNQGGNQRTRSSAGGNMALRIPIRMDFTPTPVATSRFTAQFQKRLGKLPGLTTVGPIQVVLEGETVVLRGVVASEGDRLLAADLAKLEPGIDVVKNELTVQSVAESAAEGSPVPTTATP
ncbi:MAG TPA: BON domain-containing protein [Pirellulaceae bacterium]|nr:BON domain-containing protein [Pirellulaceae bacterium]